MQYGLKEGLTIIIEDYPAIRKYSNIKKKREKGLFDSEKEEDRREYLKFLSDFKVSIDNIVSEISDNEYSVGYSSLDQNADIVPYITVKIGKPPVRKEYYGVYLFEPEGEGVYLALGLNVFPFKSPMKKTTSFNNDERRKIMEVAVSFREYIQEKINLNESNVANYVNGCYLGKSKYGRAYSSGIIFCKFYEYDKINKEFSYTEEELREDLKDYLRIYDEANEHIGKFSELFDYYVIGQETEVIEEKEVFLNIQKEDLDDFCIKQKTLDEISSSLNAGQNIIFNGVPGTGKTHLATKFAEEAMGEDGFILTTATSDWTTFDTIGGLMPNSDGELVFREGKFLQAIRENKWLIIDEINRADIDKAFGQLFTVLSKNDVELPFFIDMEKEGESEESIKIPVKIRLWDKYSSNYVKDEATYYIGKNWRIIATMNSYDKNTLFDLSYAFMRRFMFVEIEVPNSFEKLMNSWGDRAEFANILPLEEYYQDKLEKMYTINSDDNISRQLGPAIFSDIIKYINFRADLENANEQNYSKILSEAIIAYVVPQFEGLSKEQIDSSIKFFERTVFGNENDAKLVVERLNDLKSYY